MNVTVSSMIYSLTISFSSFLIIPTEIQAQACADYKIVSPLDEQLQVFSNWCTAAAVRVATSHYGRTFTQCELQGRALNLTCCPIADHTPGNDPSCHPNGTWPPAILNNVKFTFATLPDPPPWATITTEICNDRPIVSVVSELDLFNWHSVVIEGFQRQVVGIGEIHRVRVFDPQKEWCEEPCTLPEHHNPRFYTEDAFYSSEFDHSTDYTQITPIPTAPTDITTPAAPQGLRVR